MHPLTKIFIVLLALLSVLILGLTVPLAVNDQTWKDRYLAEQARATAAANSALAQSREQAEQLLQIQQQLDSANVERVALEQRLTDRNRTISDLRAEVASITNENDGVQARIDTLSATNRTQATVIEAQSSEIRERREESITLQRRNTELEDQLRDVQSQLDVALDAQRILQEQIAELERTLTNARSGGGDTAQPEAPDQSVPSPLELRGRVLDVARGQGGEERVQVNLGSRDGVRQNMRFYISRDGQFLARLVITTVDINRATGRLELKRGEIQTNDLVSGTGSGSAAGG